MFVIKKSVPGPVPGPMVEVYLVRPGMWSPKRDGALHFYRAVDARGFFHDWLSANIDDFMVEEVRPNEG